MGARKSPLLRGFIRIHDPAHRKLAASSEIYVNIYSIPEALRFFSSQVTGPPGRQ